MINQAFDAGWHAYVIPEKSVFFFLFPFFSKKELPHEQINQWQNGWQFLSTTANQMVVIVYLPQYLAYAGYGLLLLFFLGTGIAGGYYLIRIASKTL